MYFKLGRVISRYEVTEVEADSLEEAILEVKDKLTEDDFEEWFEEDAFLLYRMDDWVCIADSDVQMEMMDQDGILEVQTIPADLKEKYASLFEGRRILPKNS